ncbi:MAG TPA: response regulator transcription factor [Candidatus Eubacterium faecipullorum]|uniref:Stage 0 sporulation protein A homolog n=1 Tax=Candidatus Eubacterium faecipullorum TaxID=2838571 RepID=A0A9D1RAT5_9FIRM|nr:response regulator transcription factor [Candidatus Eubacterium faecipullorum]
MKKILIIEDDANICALERDYLEANGFEVSTAANGTTGLEAALTNNYDLILLDIMLPGTDGMEVCRRIRESKDIPILLVSAKKEDLDKITGLGYGADDYIVKPFSPKELVARVIAHISRYERLTAKNENSFAEAKTIEADGLKLDGRSRRAFVNSTELNLTNKEFDLLYFLASSPDTVFSKEDLFSKIWNYDSIGETSTVTVHVNRIRDKIKEVDPSMDFIHTVWGKGYRFNK